MRHLYEKFIFEYYRREFPQITTSASHIRWAADDGFDFVLPITLEHEGKILIIDAKYYLHTMQTWYNISTLHSSNLYQMFTYVKNAKLAMKNREVSGLILYARTDEEIQPNSVSALDLSSSFDEIAALNKIVLENLGGK